MALMAFREAKVFLDWGRCDQHRGSGTTLT